MKWRCKNKQTSNSKLTKNKWLLVLLGAWPLLPKTQTTSNDVSKKTKYLQRCKVIYWPSVCTCDVSTIMVCCSFPKILRKIESWLLLSSLLCTSRFISCNSFSHSSIVSDSSTLTKQRYGLCCRFVVPLLSLVPLSLVLSPSRSPPSLSPPLLFPSLLSSSLFLSLSPLLSLLLSLLLLSLSHTF